MVARKFVVGHTLRPGAQLDYFLVGLAYFLAVSLDGLGRIGLQELPESSVGPGLRIDLAPLATGQCSPSPGPPALAPFCHWSVSSKG